MMCAVSVLLLAEWKCVWKYETGKVKSGTMTTTSWTCRNCRCFRSAVQSLQCYQCSICVSVCIYVCRCVCACVFVWHHHHLRFVVILHCFVITELPLFAKGDILQHPSSAISFSVRRNIVTYRITNLKKTLLVNVSFIFNKWHSSLS